MAVHLIRQGGQRVGIQKYGGGRFTIGNQVFSGSVLLLPDEIRSWPVAAMDQMTVEVFAPIFNSAPSFDVCLVGCGPRTAMLPKQIRDAAKAAGVHVEVMETGAACRTFNVLIAEGRAIAAALIAI